MATEPHPGSVSWHRQWFIVGRWEKFDAEARANLLRIIGVGSFYLIESLDYHGLRLAGTVLYQARGEPDRAFHLSVTALAVAWSAMALAVLLLLRQRFFPSTLSYLSTGFDLVMVTSILILGSGPRSALVIAYPLVIVLAAMRFELPLLWFAAGGSAGGYLIVLGYARWFAQRELTIPRTSELIFLLALALISAVLGQMIRSVRRMAEEYAQRVVLLEKRP